MSDNEDFFEKQIRDKFNNFSPEVSPVIWEKIMAERKKRKPRFLFWDISNINLLLLIAAILVVSGTVIFTNNSMDVKNSEMEKLSAVVIESNQKKQIQHENETNSLKHSENELAFEEKDNKAELKEKLKEGNIQNRSSDKNNIAVSSEMNAALIAKGLSKKQAEKPQNIVSKNITKKNTYSTIEEHPFNLIGKVEKSIDFKAYKNRLSQTERDEKNDANYPDFDVEQFESNKKNNQQNLLANGFKRNQKKVGLNLKNNIINTAGTDVNIDAIEFSMTGNFQQHLQFEAEKIYSSSLMKGSYKDVQLVKITGPDCPYAEKDAASNKKYFELYASPDIAFKKYSDTANSVFLMRRKQSAQFISAFSTGVRFTKVFQNGVSFRTGINFSQINEKFSFVQGNWIQVTYTIDPNTGDTTGRTSISGTRYKTTINRYRTIDVPLLLGYEVGNGRFHFNLNAGPVINIYSWQKGEMLDTAFKPVSITTNKGATAYQYKTNTGIGFMGAISVYYKLTDRLHLLAEPYLRYNLSPISKDVFSLQEKFTTVGLRIGVRMDF